jgi:hypothetical protein
MHTRCQDTTGASSPLPELADPAGDYELSVWVHFAYDRDGAGHRPLVATGDYVLECGRKGGHWQLTTSPLLGHDDNGDLIGEPVVNVRGQVKGLQPLTTLRALLAGRVV